MAHPTDPALYVKKTDNKWHNVIGDPKYFDPAHVEYAQYSYCASWVDINRDGHLDLYVGRGDDFRELRDAVFVRGDVSATPRFAFDHAAFGFGSGDSVSTRAISWADYNGDGLWDLAICGPRAFPGHSPPPTFLYWREEVASTFAVVPVPQFQAAPLTGIFGLWYVEWVDRNQNNGFDLIVASPLDAEETNILVFSHPDAVPTISAIPSNVGGGQAGDIDLDGRPDLVLIGGLATQGDVQRSGPTTVALNVSGHPNFDQEFILTGTALGLEGANEQKFARTLALADFGGDGDLDLVLGIPDASNFSGRVKRAVAPDGGQAPRNNWLGVRLVGQAEDNPWGIGATISLSAGGLPLGSQVVQGGGGRGGQTSPTRVFGLGSHSGNVQAEVRWPLGFVQEFDINASNLNSVVSVIQSVGCNLIDTSVKCEIVFQPGGSITWVFTWTTDRWTKRTEDRVTISRQQGSDCGFEGMTLQASADDNIKVEPVQYLTAGEYKHEVRWENQTCHPACTYTYYVRSWDGRFTGTEVISSTRQLRLRVCPQAQ